MQIKKTMRACGIAAASMFAVVSFTGCFDSPTDADDITYAVDEITNPIQAGSNKQVTGEVSSDPALESLAFTIENASGEAVEESKIDVSYNSANGETSVDLEEDLNVTIAVDETACNGDYELVISGSAGSASQTKRIDFSVTGGQDCDAMGTPVVSEMLDAGANGHSSLGSSIDLDEGNVWLMADAANNVSKIDIVYLYSDADEVEKFFSPEHAKASGYNLASGWDSPPATKFYKTTLDKAGFDAIATAEEITALWNGTEAQDDSLAVEQGDVFIVMTTDGDYALVYVSSQTDGKDGQIQIKVAK